MADIEEPEEYVVERILADDVVDGNTFYLIMWEGYEDFECTWEPVESFSLRDSIIVWEKEKSAGLGLDDESLARVQARMDYFQETGKRPSISLDQAIESDSGSPTKDTERPHKKQKKAHDLIYDPPTLTASTKNTPVIKKGIAKPVKDLDKPKATQSLAKRSIKPSKAAVLRLNTNATQFQRPGQRFRNLSHMNTSRKKAREEPSPNLPPGALKSVAEFDIGRQAAHILPISLERNNDDQNDSPLFFADTSDLQAPREVSVPASESSVFPPPRATHAQSAAEMRKPSETDVERSIRWDSRQMVAPNDNNSKTQLEAEPELTTTPRVIKSNSIPVTGFKTEPPLVLPIAETPPKDDYRSSHNHRWWYYGDLLCRFLMGVPLGDATIIHVPHFPFGKSIMHLKNNLSLELNFGSISYNPVEFDQTFANPSIDARAIGVVCPYENTQQGFNDFAEHLEKHNSAAVFSYVDNHYVEYSLVLYSINSTSWRRKYGWKPARSGASRLHLAFLPKLVPRPHSRPRSPDRQQPVTSIVNTETFPPTTGNEVPSSLHRTQRTGSVSGQRARSPSLSRGVGTMSIKSPKSPRKRSDSLIKAPESPSVRSETHENLEVTLTPRSPGLMQSQVNGGHRPRPKTRSSEDEVPQFTHVPGSSENQQLWVKLDYNHLLPVLASNTKVDRNRPIFFISFAQSQPKDAEAVQTWLEQKTEPRNIYLDSERFGWQRFHEKFSSSVGMTVLLFHEDHPNYHQLPGLGILLSPEYSICFSISFKRKTNSDPDLSSTLIRTLFPKSAAYLITESMIIRNLEETLTIVRFFDSQKKPGYKMVMRPNIEQWLLEYASKVSDEQKRGMLIDLLVLVRSLHPSSDLLEELGVNSNSQMVNSYDLQHSTQVSYISSPDDIPGYNEVLRAIGNRNLDLYSDNSNVHDLRDDILRSYFYAYSAIRSDRIRRFIAFYPHSSSERHKATIKQMEKDGTIDCGHIAFQEIEKFVVRYCKPGTTSKKRDHDGEKKVKT